MFLNYGKKGEFMTNIASSFNSKKYIVILLSSVLGGVLNGFLGAGGGILIGLVLTRLLKKNGELLCDRRDIYANVQLAMICVSLVSLSIYSSRGGVDFSTADWIILPALAGGAVGSLILRKMSSGVIGKIFAILVVWSGIRMILG